MKKLLFTTLTILTCGVSYALPLGNPAEASLMCDGVFYEGNCDSDLWDFWCDPCTSWCDIFSFRVGFYGDYVFNRHMELQNFGGGDMEKTEIYTNAGYVALNLFNQIDIFTSLGASNFSLEGNSSLFGQVAGARVSVFSETQFSWSIGGRATLVECGCWFFGIEGQYFSFKPDIERVTVSALESSYPDDTVDVWYHEWQVGIGLSYRINMFVPYMGLKWARSKLDTNNVVVTTTSAGNPILRDLESKKLWGYALGVTLLDCDMASVTAEARFADEKALYVNGQFRF